MGKKGVVLPFRWPLSIKLKVGGQFKQEYKFWSKMAQRFNS